MFDRAESVGDTLSNTRHCLPVRAVLYNNRIFKLYSPHQGLYFSYPMEIVISNSLEKYFFIRSITLSNRNFYCLLLPNVWRNFLRLFNLLFNSLLLNCAESCWYFSSVDLFYSILYVYYALLKKISSTNTAPAWTWNANVEEKSLQRKEYFSRRNKDLIHFNSNSTIVLIRGSTLAKPK